MAETPEIRAAVAAGTATPAEEAAYNAAARAKPAPLAPPAQPAGRPLVIAAAPSATANYKGLILAEMFVLLGSAVAVHRSRGEAWVDIFRTTAIRTMMAVVILLIGLLTAADLGLGGPAAAFGGLIVLGYVAGAAGYLGPAILSLEQNALGPLPPASQKLPGETTGGANPHTPLGRNIP